jgi:hypothetical protein
MGIEGEGLVFVVYSDAIATMPGRFVVKKFFLHNQKRRRLRK